VCKECYDEYNCSQCRNRAADGGCSYWTPTCTITNKKEVITSSRCKRKGSTESNHNRGGHCEGTWTDKKMIDGRHVCTQCYECSETGCPEQKVKRFTNGAGRVCEGCYNKLKCVGKNCKAKANLCFGVDKVCGRCYTELNSYVNDLTADFRRNQCVGLKGLSNAAYNGQTGTIHGQSNPLRSAGRWDVKLHTSGYCVGTDGNPTENCDVNGTKEEFEGKHEGSDCQGTWTGKLMALLPTNLEFTPEAFTVGDRVKMLQKPYEKGKIISLKKDQCQVQTDSTKHNRGKIICVLPKDLMLWTPEHLDRRRLTSTRGRRRRLNTLERVFADILPSRREDGQDRD